MCRGNFPIKQLFVPHWGKISVESVFVWVLIVQTKFALYIEKGIWHNGGSSGIHRS